MHRERIEATHPDTLDTDLQSNQTQAWDDGSWSPKMQRVWTSLVLLLAAAATASAFTFPQQPPPLRRQNAMRMSYREQEEPAQPEGPKNSNNNPLPPPSDDDLEALERRLPPAVATLLRLASTLAMGGAYLASPVMGACVLLYCWLFVDGRSIGQDASERRDRQPPVFTTLPLPCPRTQ